MHAVRRVALVYDDVHAPPPGTPPHAPAEWEDARTIEALRRAVEAAGAHCTPLRNDGALARTLTEGRFDAVFNIAEGAASRSRTALVPALCERLGLRCTGSDAAGHAVTLDKHITRLAAAAAGLPVPAGVYGPADDEALPAAARALGFPLFVKPAGEGSSIGIDADAVVRDAAALQARLTAAGRHGPVLIERFLPGDELTVGLLGRDATLRALPPAWVRYEGSVYSNAVKSKDTMGERIEPAHGAAAAAAAELSVRVCRALHLRGPLRVDWRCDGDGRPWFLEINSTPGLSPFYSSLPIIAGFAGIDFNALVGTLLDDAV